MKPKTYKTRAFPRYFRDGNIVEQQWLAELYINRKWTPLGDENGWTLYKTKEEAETAANQVRDQLCNSNA